MTCSQCCELLLKEQGLGTGILHSLVWPHICSLVHNRPSDRDIDHTLHTFFLRVTQCLCNATAQQKQTQHHYSCVERAGLNSPSKHHRFSLRYHLPSGHGRSECAVCTCDAVGPSAAEWSKTHLYASACDSYRSPVQMSAALLSAGCRGQPLAHWYMPGWLLTTARTSRPADSPFCTLW